MHCKRARSKFIICRICYSNSILPEKWCWKRHFQDCFLIYCESFRRTRYRFFLICTNCLYSIIATLWHVIYVTLIILFNYLQCLQHIISLYRRAKSKHQQKMIDVRFDISFWRCNWHFDLLSLFLYHSQFWLRSFVQAQDDKIFELLKTVGVVTIWVFFSKYYNVPPSKIYVTSFSLLPYLLSTRA